ncbi:MAG: M16 family metallopeptidase, partial [Caldilinea sp.]
MKSIANALPSPETVFRTTLPNGLTILVREDHTSPVTVLQGSLRVGAAHETPEQAGLAAFVAGMLTRGSAHYDYSAFNAAVENVGASLTASADIHSTDFSITSLAEDFEQMIRLLADIMRRPTFPEDHIERLRRMKLVHIQEREQDTASVAARRFNESLFGRRHPYGRATEGYIETVSALRRQDLVDFHTCWYTPRGGVLAIAGDVDARRIVDVMADALGDWQMNAPPHPTIEPTRIVDFQRIHAPMPG